MDKRDKGYTLYKKGLSCTEISKKLDVSINTVKSWRKRYWTQGADAPAKRTLHPEDAPTAPDPETRPKQGGRLIDHAPTILRLLGLEPIGMDGHPVDALVRP